MMTSAYASSELDTECPQCHQRCLPLCHGSATATQCQNPNCQAVVDRDGKVLVAEADATLTTPQPSPTPNSQPAIWDLVITDMQARDRLGEKKYGTRLQPFNHRDALVDAYQEALDLVVYLRQAIFERGGK